MQSFYFNKLKILYTDNRLINFSKYTRYSILKKKMSVNHIFIDIIMRIIKIIFITYTWDIWKAILFS